ncbi:hypothetical protein E0Z10_g10906 [Xylaria hypoxylon]|uniref:Uncharacterized protein n=1 Tax=Xylaria hypoxylon TaxID=37992 RepID=A0A4Z0YA81_9PEZI|nr:hypothetical protein E0Z10_g10906 [Xylaria hypoxylon]
MAPYTMKININNPVTEITYVASARLSGDGYVTATGNNIPARTTSTGASLAKGGGHEGLFIATFFAVHGCAKNLLVWSSMSAKSDGKVIVLIAFVDSHTSITSIPNLCYNDPSALGLTDGKVQASGVINGNGVTFTVTLAGYDTTYPDATATLTTEIFAVA